MPPPQVYVLNVPLPWAPSPSLPPTPSPSQLLPVLPRWSTRLGFGLLRRIPKASFCWAFNDLNREGRVGGKRTLTACSGCSKLHQCMVCASTDHGKFQCENDKKLKQASQK